MSNPFFLPPDPSAAPDPVTPADGPGDPRGWGEVTPHTVSTAPYDISAPQDIAGISAATQAAMGLSGGGEGVSTGAGIPNRDSPRQQQTAAILYSPQGADSSNVFSGFPDYENQDLRPPADVNGPIQGHTSEYPGTTQDGVPQFMTGLGSSAGGGLPGVPPEGGSMASSPGGDYPGTVQDGITKYGTS